MIFLSFTTSIAASASPPFISIHHCGFIIVLSSSVRCLASQGSYALSRSLSPLTWPTSCCPIGSSFEAPRMVAVVSSEAEGGCPDTGPVCLYWNQTLQCSIVRCVVQSHCGTLSSFQTGARALRIILTLERGCMRRKYAIVSARNLRSTFS